VESFLEQPRFVDPETGKTAKLPDEVRPQGRGRNPDFVVKYVNGVIQPVEVSTSQEFETSRKASQLAKDTYGIENRVPTQDKTGARLVPNTPTHKAGGLTVIDTTCPQCNRVVARGNAPPLQNRPTTGTGSGKGQPSVKSGGGGGPGSILLILLDASINNFIDFIEAGLRLDPEARLRHGDVLRVTPEDISAARRVEIERQARLTARFVAQQHGISIDKADELLNRAARSGPSYPTIGPDLGRGFRLDTILERIYRIESESPRGLGGY
jgi:hypothetical protein